MPVQERVKYFSDFLKKQPVGQFEVIPGVSPCVKMLGPGVASLSGTAKFTLRAANDAQVRVRKTFVFCKVGGAWRISEHHSSMMPASA